MTCNQNRNQNQKGDGVMNQQQRIDALTREVEDLKSFRDEVLRLFRGLWGAEQRQYDDTILTPFSRFFASIDGEDDDE